jgi:aconitate hydratase
VHVVATSPQGLKTEFDAICRADVPIEIQYIANGGVLPFVLRRMIQ